MRRIFVDVDDVLEDRRFPQSAVIALPAPVDGDFEFRYDRRLTDALLQLSLSTGARLTWCTTWEQLANEHLSPLFGWPELDVVPMPRRPKFGRQSVTPIAQWRWQQLSRFIAEHAEPGEDNSWAWLDNDAHVLAEPADVPHVWAERLVELLENHAGKPRPLTDLSTVQAYFNVDVDLERNIPYEWRDTTEEPLLARVWTDWHPGLDRDEPTDRWKEPAGIAIKVGPGGLKTRHLDRAQAYLAA